MKLAQVTEGFAVSPQLRPEELQELAQGGYATVICNRPDGEDPDQPTVEAMRSAAEAAGIAFHHIPVSGGAFPPAAIRAFAQVRKGAEGKVLAYCRTGTRSITLDALANTEQLTADERIGRAKMAGYDLAAMRDQLTQ